MLSDRVLQRLSELNRAPLPVPAREQPPMRKREASLPAGSEAQNACGAHWLIERPLAALWPAAERVLSWRPPPAAAFGEQGSQPRPDLAVWAEHFPQQTVYLDLETCGLAGSMVFLAGLIHVRGGELTISQLLARSYAEESALLLSLRRMVAANRVLVTYNGKTFDWTQVRDRSTLHRIDRLAGGAAEAQTAPRPSWPEPIHVDLLHHARRRFRDELPNCRLQTLERFLCGRRRVGDIPGSEIPDAYHAYVRNGDPSDLKAILHHNALDLVTLVQVSLMLAREAGDVRLET